MQTLDQDRLSDLDEPLGKAETSPLDVAPPVAPSYKQWSGLFLALAAGILLWTTHLWDWWEISREISLLSHAPLLIGLAAFHFWIHRGRLRSWESANPWGLVLMVVSGLLLLSASLGDVIFLRFFSLLGLTMGAILFLGGFRALKASLGPLGFLFLALPPPTFLVERLTPTLQHSITAYTALACGMLGFPIYRNGFQLSILPDPSAPPVFSILVGHMCSGLASLLVLLALGYTAAYHTPIRNGRKALMIAAMLPLTLLANGFRAGSILLAGAYHSPALAHWLHVYESVFLLFFSSFGILGIRKLFMVWEAPLLKPESGLTSGIVERDDAEGMKRKAGLIAPVYPFRIPITVTCLLLVFLGSTWARQEEVGPVRGTDELSLLEIPFRDWVELDLDLTPNEVALIRPEAALMRRYESPHGESVELTVVASRNKRSLYTAQYLLSGEEFVAERQEARTISLLNRRIPVTHATLSKPKGDRVVVLSFFTDGNFATDNISRYQWNRTLRRIRGDSTLGALVRVSVPVQTDSAAADARASEFAQAAFPKALDAVRELGQRQ
ncbi:MAG: EpsI family protein [Armatimonadetes bacterium]|nr:EpsI family protein [Armatimonadota bacterium]